MGILLSYSPTETLEMDSRQKHLCNILMREREIGYNDLKAKAIANGKMGHNQFDRVLKELKKREIIINTECGKYRLRKPVKCIHSRNPFRNIRKGGIIQDSITTWYDIKEAPHWFIESLRENGLIAWDEKKEDWVQL